MGKSEHRTWLVVPDLHFRFHDLKFCNLITKVIKKLRTESDFAGIVQLGDFCDFWQISAYDKDPIRKESIYDDLLLFSGYLDKWAAEMPKGSVCHVLEGNHEKRLARYAGQNAPKIFEMLKTIPEVLRFPQRNAEGRVKFKWHPYAKWDSCKISNTVFHHGFYFPQHAAAKNLATYPTNFVCGHVHRVQYVTDGEKFSVTLGHGSDPKLTMHTPTPTNWQQAFGVFYASPKLDRIDIIPVSKGECILWGKPL